MTAEDTGLAAGAVVFEPDVGASYGNGWKQLWKHFLELLLIVIISWVLGLPSALVQWLSAAGPGLMLFNIIYALLVTGPVSYGVSYAYLKAARGEKLEIQDMFAAFRNYWNAVLASLLAGVIIGIGLFLLIVPGIIFACKLAFTPYLVVDRKMDVIDAIKGSWNMTSGYAGRVFLIGLLGVPIFILGLICLGVGVIPAVMWISCAFASLYHAVSLRKGMPVQEGPAPQPHAQQGPISE